MRRSGSPPSWINPMLAGVGLTGTVSAGALCGLAKSRAVIKSVRDSAKPACLVVLLVSGETRDFLSDGCSAVGRD